MRSIIRYIVDVSASVVLMGFVYLVVKAVQVWL